VNVTIKPCDLITRLSPEDLATLAPPPGLLPGESLERYHFMRQAIVSDIAPQSAIEWLLVIDIIELSWEIERYRLLRTNVLRNFRQQAIEQGLRRIDLAGSFPEDDPTANRHIHRNAVDWQIDPDAASEIETRLAAHGIDQQAINAENFVQAREHYLLFQALLDSAQGRRIALLREIKLLRAAAAPFGRNAGTKLGRPEPAAQAGNAFHSQPV
jgi:hypothetical protein